MYYTHRTFNLQHHTPILSCKINVLGVFEQKKFKLEILYRKTGI